MLQTTATKIWEQVGLQSDAVAGVRHRVGLKSDLPKPPFSRHWRCKPLWQRPAGKAV